MQAADVRPLSIGEKLDVAIKIYMRNALTLFKIVLIIVAPVQIVTALVLASAIPDSALLDPQSPLDPAQPVQPDIDGGDIAAFIAGFGVVFLLSLVASTLATAACYKAIGDAYLGETPDWRSSLAFAGRRLHSVLWVLALQFLIAGGLLFASILVSAALAAALGDAFWALGALLILGVFGVTVWWWTSWVIAVPAFLTENVKGRRALGRSYRLVQGRWWRTFGFYFVGSLMVGVVAGLITQLLNSVLLLSVGDSLPVTLTVDAFSSTVAAVITTPFSAAFLTVLYFDLRVRKEGFDLQLLAQSIGISPQAMAGLRPVPRDLPPPAVPGEGNARPPYWPPPPGWSPPGPYQAPHPQPPGPPPAPPGEPGSPSAPPPSPYSPEGFGRRPAPPSQTPTPPWHPPQEEPPKPRDR